ncbi:unannotated protein [freshwater metagenome]|uniref:Unannotated protein n=1 Tax=freshwater metagenome TaxID=449393 RepID=A0A6J5ZX18_9ZZZZ
MKSALFLWQARFALAIPGVSASVTWTQGMLATFGGPPCAGSQSKAGRVSPTPRGSKPTKSKDFRSDGDVAGNPHKSSPGAPGPPGLVKRVPVFVPDAGSFCSASVNCLPFGLP